MMIDKRRRKRLRSRGGGSEEQECWWCAELPLYEFTVSVSVWVICPRRMAAWASAQKHWRERERGRSVGHGSQEIVPFRHRLDNNLNSSNICKPTPTNFFKKVIAIKGCGLVVIFMEFYLSTVASRRITIGRRPPEFIQDKPGWIAMDWICAKTNP